MFRRAPRHPELPGFVSRFRGHSAGQVARTVKEVLSHQLGRERFVADLTTAGFFRPDLSVPAYAGLAPTDGLAPLYHFFDRTTGGHLFAGRVTRGAARDYRGGLPTYG